MLIALIINTGNLVSIITNVSMYATGGGENKTGNQIKV